MPTTGPECDVSHLPDSGGVSSPAPFVDHTLLKAETTPDQIERLCEEAVEWGFAAVCVPPSFVAQSSGLLYGSGVAVATVIGFPFGYADTQVKVFETHRVLDQGAEEIDMVIAIGRACAGEWRHVEKDIREVVLAAEGRPVKAILECSALNEDGLRQAARAALDAGVAYLKTSTGFGDHGARVADVALLHRLTDGRASVKASGGIRDLAACLAMLRAGATRIGTSSGVEIMRQWRERTHV